MITRVSPFSWPAWNSRMSNERLSYVNNWWIVGHSSIAVGLGLFGEPVRLPRPDGSSLGGQSRSKRAARAALGEQGERPCLGRTQTDSSSLGCSARLTWNGPTLVEPFSRYRSAGPRRTDSFSARLSGAVSSVKLDVDLHQWLIFPPFVASQKESFQLPHCPAPIGAWRRRVCRGQSGQLGTSLRLRSGAGQGTDQVRCARQPDESSRSHSTAPRHYEDRSVLAQWNHSAARRSRMSHRPANTLGYNTTNKYDATIKLYRCYTRESGRGEEEEDVTATIRL